MKHHTLALICFSAFFILQTGLLCAKSEEPATDYVGAMFNLNFVFPIEFASSSDDDVEDLYGAFFSLFPGSLDTRRNYYGVVLSGMGVVERGGGVQGGICYWGQEGRGLSFGLLSTGFDEMKGIQIGGITGASLFASRSFLSLTDLKGIQIGGINVANKSWGQCGVWNYVRKNDSCVQIGVLNECGEEGGGIQVGVWNSFKTKRHSFPRDDSTVQLGLINVLPKGTSHENKSTLQIGLLNRTRSGWWLPISNFGL